MQSAHQLIRYLVDVTQLDIPVKPTSKQAISKSYFRPWLTMCVEPVSRTIPAFILSCDPPSLTVLRSLLYQALAPSKEHPDGRRPDALVVDSSSWSVSLQKQELFQQLQIAVEQAQRRGADISERAFSSLFHFLQRDFSDFSVQEEKIEQHEILLAQVEAVCRRWRDSSPLTSQDQQEQDYLASCHTSWKTRPLTFRDLDGLLDGPYTSIISDKGIVYRGGTYWHPDLSALVNQNVSLRALASCLPPSDIEIFVQERWVCSAPLVLSEIAG